MPVPTSPYPLVSDISRRVRAIINDMGSSTGLAGNMFADTQPYVVEYVQMGYEKLQKILARNGYEFAKKEVILTPITPIVTPDAGVQVFVSFTGYNDGTNNHFTPTLPADLLIPVRLWERITGSTNEFWPMDSVIDALPSCRQGSFLRMWQWRDSDELFFIGATQSLDVRMEYKRKLPILGTTSSPVLINDCVNACAYLTAVGFAEARADEGGSPIAETWKNYADEAIGDLLAPTQQMKARQNPRRRPYSGGYWRR